MYICVLGVCLVFVEDRRGHQVPGTGVADGCELPCKFRELDPCLLQEQQALLSSVPAFSPQRTTILTPPLIQLPPALFRYLLNGGSDVSFGCSAAKSMNFEVFIPSPPHQESSYKVGKVSISNNRNKSSSPQKYVLLLTNEADHLYGSLSSHKKFLHCLYQSPEWLGILPGGASTW